MRVAIIGGSGFSGGLGIGEPEIVGTEFGEALLTRSVGDDGLETLFIARHGAGHKIPPHEINHKANIKALQDMGVEAVFATAAVGSLRKGLAPGDYVLPDDFIDMTKGNVVTFHEKSGAVQHTDMSYPFSQDLREALVTTYPTSAGSVVHPTGTYLCLSGPRYETAAEIRMFAHWGADVIGMTVAPEAILCRELGLPYAAVSVVTNYASGLVSHSPLSHAEVEEQMAVSVETLKEWLVAARGHLG